MSRGSIFRALFQTDHIRTNLAPGRFANVMVPRGVLALTLTRLEILRITGQEEGWIFRAEVRWNSYLRFLRYAHQQDATAYERRRRIALFVFLSFLVVMPAVENLDKVAILFIISCFSVEFSFDKIPITVICICISTWVLVYLYTKMRMRVKKKKKKNIKIEKYLNITQFLLLSVSIRLPWIKNAVVRTYKSHVRASTLNK